MASGNRAGRPLKFKTPELLQEKIDNYFKSISYEQPMLKEDGSQVINGLGEKVMQTVYISEPSITGLALYLDTSRETLCQYENRDDYFDIIKEGKLRVEHAYENRLITRGRTVDIFALKNFGWTDERSQKNTNYNVEAPPTIIDDSKGIVDV
jgi:hypothetical protein